jgi:outer membrane protein assembly factor BamB
VSEARGGGIPGFPAPPGAAGAPGGPAPHLPPPVVGGTPLWLKVLGVVVVLGTVPLFVLFAALDRFADDVDHGRSRGDAAWSVPLAGAARTSGLVTDGDVVCATRTATLVCVDAATGEAGFTTRLEGEATAPQLAGGTLVVGDGGRYPFEYTTLHGISARSGKELWSSERVPEGTDQLSLAHGFALVDGTLAAPRGRAALDTTLEGLAPRTGSMRWHLDTDSEGGSFLTSEVFGLGPRAYTTAYDGEGLGRSGLALVAVEPATGAELWRHSLGGLPVVTDLTGPADGSTVTLVLKEGDDVDLVTLDGATGAQQWATPLRDDFPRVAVSGGTTVVQEGSRLRGLDREGQQRWAAAVPEGRTFGRLVQVPGHLYLVGVNVYEVEPRSGRVDLVLRDVVGDDLVVAEDLLVLSTLDGLEAHPLD